MATATPPNITSQAHNLRGRVVDLNSTKPTPVITAAAVLGFTVNEFNPTEETDEISGAVDHGSKTIYINASESAMRKRFTVAHEIGHIVLHGEDGDVIDYRKDIGTYGPDIVGKEREANEFAAELLMPRNVFEALWNAYDGSVKDVAERLEVSAPAAKVRASRLRLG